ncbi:MAG: PepSY domain-containing protein [Paracoccaceae bacterium]|nr:PepSY domain-containing protein [Paracoccaceae bacterium]
MKKILLATVFAAFAAPVLAEPSCTPGEAVKPVWESMKAFEETGGVVKSFKINDGACYEIYGTVDGKNYEVFFDPNTGAELERIEA